MFAGKAEAYPSEAPCSCSILGQAPGLAHKHIRLVWKGLPGTNALAYYKKS
jgi:hypothetical protein